MTSEHSWFGPKPSWWPAWLIFSPALLILWAPGGFRVTCYYYRGAYYKAFWADPPSCAVGEPRKSYWGERSLPLVLQNVHRYFLYLALLFLVFLASDVYKAFWFKDAATGVVSFGVGVGTLVLALNVVLLGGYTLGCHSLAAPGGRRHRPVDTGPGAAPRLRLRELPEPAAHGLGLVQPVLGGVQRPVRAALFDGRLD